MACLKNKIKQDLVKMLYNNSHHIKICYMFVTWEYKLDGISLFFDW